MRKKNSTEQGIRIKMGIVFFIIILYFPGIFLYSYHLKNNMNDLKREINNSYLLLSLSNTFISSVQQAQDISNTYLVSPRSKYIRQYDSISASLSAQIKEMQEITSDNEKSRLVKNISVLLDENNTTIHQLRRQFSSRNPLKELDESISTYDLPQRDSVVLASATDTTITVKENKSFWARFRGLFDPKQVADTVVNVISVDKISRLSPDTVLYENIKTTTQKASNQYKTNIRGIERQVQELIVSEHRISLQISQLLTQLHNETIRSITAGIGKSDALNQKIFRFSVLSGIISLLLILTIILLIANDLRKGQKAKEDLIAEKQKTEDLMSSRHKLLLSVSHDVKTPLTSIMGYLDVWNADEAAGKKKQQIESAKNSGKHILSMLSNLLEFSRLEQKSQKPDIALYDLIELCKEITEMFRPLTRQKNIAIAFENEAGSPFYVKTDQTIVKQILTNIVSNAVKYTFEGKVDIKLQQSTADRITFFVCDTGIGIAENDLREVFKPFSRINNVENVEGNGFGLYVTKGLVESLGGNIHIKSEVGKGTCVIINLPLKKEPAPVNIITPNEKTDTPKTQKILIFEDDAALGNMLKETLQQMGHEAALCNDRACATGYLDQLSGFDAVITDLDMNGITGIDILTHIREKHSTIPVWIMTAHGDYTKQTALKDGFNGLIKKPLSREILSDLFPGKKIPLHENVLMNAFPSLIALFGNDRETILDVLRTFMQTSSEDLVKLDNAIAANDFTAARPVCHKMQSMLAQLDAPHLCTTLRKIDKLGNEETFPEWKEELATAIREIKSFTEEIKSTHLGNPD